MADFNADDPATWPEDIEGLAALAAGATHPNPAGGLVETAGGLAPAVSDAPRATGDGSLADGAAAADRPAGVATRDGRHVMPYERFEEVQQRAQQAETRAAELESRIAALEAAQQGAAPAAGTPPGQADGGAAPASIADRLEAARSKLAEMEGSDPQLAELARTTVGTLEELHALQGRIAQMDAWMAGQREQEAARGRADLDAALQRHPILAAWMSAPDQTWAERAIHLEAQLEAVPGSRLATARSLDERLAALVEAVHATYGLSPEAVRQAQQQPAPAAPRGGALETPLASAALPPPPSLGAMGGEALSGAGQDLASLERMTPAQLLAHTRRLDSRQLASLVARVA